MRKRVAVPGRRPLRNSEMASSGPNSPTAPTAVTARPNCVGSSPSSRSTGMSVPSAVDDRATPTYMAAMAGPTTKPISTPAMIEMSQPTPARRSGRPLILAKSIS